MQIKNAERCYPAWKNYCMQTYFGCCSSYTIEKCLAQFQQEDKVLNFLLTTENKRNAEPRWMKEEQFFMLRGKKNALCIS